MNFTALDCMISFHSFHNSKPWHSITHQDGCLCCLVAGGEKPLSSSARLAIALDVALGLQHLHVGRNPGIIHRNVKPANILLSKKMVAKVADFGFVEFTGEKDSKLRGYSVDLTGITGYLDPE